MLEKNTKTRDFLELMETILTIVVSLVALSGTITAYKKGFFHKLNHVVEHYHQEALESEQRVATEWAEINTNRDNIAKEQVEITNQANQLKQEKR